LFREEMFSAGGPRERAPDAMRVRTARKSAKTKNQLETNLRSTLRGRPQRRKRAAAEAASWCAEDAAELRHARKPLHREPASRLLSRFQRARKLMLLEHG
jgi:hypothetical protein